VRVRVRVGVGPSQGAVQGAVGTVETSLSEVAEAVAEVENEGVFNVWHVEPAPGGHRLDLQPRARCSDESKERNVGVR
jgi:hypothetical protein